MFVFVATFFFVFFHIKPWLKQMEEIQERQNASKFIGVFMQFCLLSVSKKQSITTQQKKEERRQPYLTRQDKIKFYVKKHDQDIQR